MPTLNLITKYRKNEGLIISPEELQALYFYGVPIKSKDGSSLDPNTIEMYIRSAQSEVEKFFDIKLFPQLITETKDYYRDDYSNNFPFVRTSLPVKQILTLIGRINGIDQIEYPQEWLQARSSSDGTVYRQFSVVPNGSVVNADADVIFTGVSSYYGIRSYPNVPNYWFVQYDTGFDYDKVPYDLLNLIGMLAAIPLLAIAGDLILGAGIASQSLSIDGLSQSISSTSSATNAGYGARIVEYRKSILATIKRLHRYYKGITFVGM
jgi:hypothetical protein